MRRGNYYLGRVQKFGNLDNQLLLDALKDPPIVKVGKYDWTFTDTISVNVNGIACYFSHLSKYSTEGHFTIVDIISKKQEDETAENLLISSSPFVYIPEFSGIAYLHVWNHIQEAVFRRRFSQIVKEKHDNFFVDCEIELISDYRKFVTKLKEIELFTEITAKVFPPNPLFGDLWKNLNKYIKDRNASEIKIDEKSNKIDGLSSDLLSIIEDITDEKISSDTKKRASITDAAVLMAADGYGSSKIVGKSRDKEVIIRTHDTKKSFLFDKDPQAKDLAEEVEKQFSGISEERNMEH